MRVLCVLGVVFAGAGSGGCGVPKQPIKTECSTALPLDYAGTRMTYDGDASLEFVAPMTVDFTGMIIYGGEEAWVLRQTILRMWQGEQIQIVREGYHACDDEGVWLLGESIQWTRVDPGDLIDHAYDFLPPVQVFPPDPKPGDAWSSTYTLQGSLAGVLDDGPVEGERSRMVDAKGSMEIDGETRTTLMVALEDSVLEVPDWEKYALGIGLVKNPDVELLGLAR